jgi:hypothetical protein
MGSKTISTVAPKIADIQLQTSAYGGVIPVVFGTNRIAGNLIWYGNFTAVPHTTSSSSGGKGMGKVTSKNTTFTYTAAVMMALCEGTIAGIGAVWKGKDKTTLTALGLTLFAGGQAQAAWSFRSSYDGTAVAILRENAFGFYGQAVGFAAASGPNYSGTAYLAASAYDLGDSAGIPNHGFEVRGLNIYGGAIADANPADIIPAMLTNTEWGAGLTSGLLGSLTQFDAYCRAFSMFFSPAYTAQQATADCIKELTDAANTALVWSDTVLKFIPYGDTTATANGATYTPNTTPVYNLTDANFLCNPGDDPVKVIRSAASDASNRLQVEFLDRAAQYNTAIANVEDQANIEALGLRIAPVQQAHIICDAGVARTVAQQALQRGLYKRNDYSFSLGGQFALLEPMDLVTLTSGYLNLVPVRILSVEEDADDLVFTAEDAPPGVATTPLYTSDSGRRYQATPNAVPSSVTAPFIFELAPDINSLTGLAVGIAVGGQTADQIYGGCRVWLSLDGTTYKEAGIIYGSSRYGTLTASYAAGTGLDTTHTLSVMLAANGQMLSGSAADALNASTSLTVEREFCSYTTATLTGTNAYTLTSVQRGQFNSIPVAHASGAPWARIDDTVCHIVNLDPKLVGTTVYFKFTAFNAYASGEQDLSLAAAYTYTVAGYAMALGKFANIATGATNNTPVVSASAPSSPTEGMLWKDTTTSSLKLYTAGSWLRMASDSLSGITATGSTGTLAGSASLGFFPGTITTSASVTATPSGGSAYSYSWGLYSGTAMTVGSATSAATNFSKSCNSGETFTAVYRCTITSTAGATTGATCYVDVSVTITETHTTFSVSASGGGSVYALQSGAGYATTPTVTGTAAGGTPSYTYAWTYYSGDSFLINSPSSATTSFTAYVAAGGSKSGSYLLTATDSASLTATTIVSVNISATGGGGTLP